MSCRCLAVAMLAAASESASANKSLEFLRSSFPSEIQIEWLNNRSLRFCLDNTCEEVVFHIGTKVGEAEEIVAIYLFYKSGYWLLEDWRKQTNVQNFVDKAVDKHTPPLCAELDYSDTPKCVLHWLLKSRQIRILDIRYDEGAGIVSPRETSRRQSNK